MYPQARPPQPVPLAELAQLVGAPVPAEDILIHGVSSIDDIVEGTITMALNRAALERVEQSTCAAVIVPSDLKPGSKPCLYCADPRLAFARLLTHFAPAADLPEGIHPSAIIGSNVTLGDRVGLGAHVVIGDDCILGDRVSILANTVVGRGVVIGEDTVIHPNVTIYDRTRIGCRVIIHAGTCLGSDGFGYVRDKNRQFKMPQLGIVEIGDEVELGSNVSVDRATTGVTRIGKGTKIDNLVQVAHNVQIGEDCVIAGQAGISGSTRIGDRVTMGGQSAVAQHIVIADDAMIAGRSGVTRDIDQGAVISGYPSRPHREMLRIEAALQYLPELVRRLRSKDK